MSDFVTRVNCAALLNFGFRPEADEHIIMSEVEAGKSTDALLFFTIRCICGLLKNKTRVLVTHQLQHLRTNDHILILKEVCVDEDHFRDAKVMARMTRCT